MEAHSLTQGYSERAVPDSLKRIAISALTLTWAVFYSFCSWGQTIMSPMGKITINDKVLESTLNEYKKVTKAKVIAIFIEQYDSDYTYTLYEFGLFDMIKRNPTTTYGEWHDSILLVYSGVESVVGPLDSMAVNKIQKYLRPILPNQVSEENVYKNGMVEESIIYFDPIIWRLKVRDGKPLWVRKGLAYQSEKVPYLK